GDPGLPAWDFMATKPMPALAQAFTASCILGLFMTWKLYVVITASIQSSLAAPKRQSSMLVWVLKPKALILPAFFISAAQSLKGVTSSMPVRAGTKKRSK